MAAHTALRESKQASCKGLKDHQETQSGRRAAQRPLSSPSVCKQAATLEGKILNFLNNLSPLTNSLRELMTRQRGGEPSANEVVHVTPPTDPPQELYLPQEDDEQEPTEQERLAVVERQGRRMSKAQLKEFRDAFRLFDKDGDGSITQEELGRVMRSLGQFACERELQQMLREVDINGDGKFSFDEFVEIVSNMNDQGEVGTPTKDQEEKELRDAFRVFDKHNRGYISASDLRAVLQCLGEDLSEEEIEDMIKEVDVDGDGRIDFYEFVHALGEPGEDDDEDDDDLGVNDF
ncbi:uncharacterized protein LOC135934974 isoform X1 [Cloeon dipterum]|uniref:uncharacterized protein LOC135934974 isoform X1 n=1 Tax=Cloeon dipterum TaxID=197152 RepID=UPI00321FBE4F